VKADLYTAQVRIADSGGIAHRTAAGFVVLTSADGGDIIALIDANQNESNLVDRVVETIGANSPAAFAMLFTASSELYLIAAGTAKASIKSPSTQLSMSPVEDQILVHPLSAGLNQTQATIELHIGTVTGSGAANIDLQSGTLEAGWLQVTVGGTVAEEVSAPLEAAPVAHAEPADPPATPPFAASIPETAVVPEPVAPQPEPVAPQPEPVGAEPEPVGAGPAPAGPIMVLGVACSQGHHNHPDAVYCSQCGTKMGVHHTTVLLNGPRPPLGVLVIDDGTTYSLSQDLVIGREPTSHDDVIAGTASPMILTDDTLSLSRRHARIVLDDWSVFLQDLGSSNGTYLSRAGQANAWNRVEPASTLPLEPGDRIRVGGRIIQVELHHVR